MVIQKQLLSSPTISHDDEYQQSDGSMGGISEERKEATDDETDKKIVKDEIRIVVKHLQVFYEKRDILDLAANIVGSKSFVQYTVLPENNVKCFFQNRAQYWRLSSKEREDHDLEKCPCCDFTQPLNQGPTANNMNVKANVVTDSLMTFLKNNEQTNALPCNSNKRIINSTPFGQPMQQSHQHQPLNNGFFNSFNGNYTQTIAPCTNNGNGYGTTLALLNLINNASRNASNAFQSMSCNNTNTTRYFNNINNGYSLYKQF